MPSIESCNLGTLKFFTVPHRLAAGCWQLSPLARTSTLFRTQVLLVSFGRQALRNTTAFYLFIFFKQTWILCLLFKNPFWGPADGIVVKTLDSYIATAVQVLAQRLESQARCVCMYG